MNIYKSAMIRIPEGWNIGEVVGFDTLDGVSTLLWEKRIPHICRLDANTNTGHVDGLEIEVEEDTLDKLLEHFVIDLHEYNELYQADEDFIILI